MADERLLRIYLNDHLALATAAVRLARRSAKSNAGSDLGRTLERIAAELDDERHVFARAVEALGYRRNRAKEAAAVVGERLGLLKLNGHVVSPSPLSRVVELEALAALVGWNARAWRTLAGLPRLAERLAPLDLERLATEADERQAELDRFRPGAASTAFVG